MRTCTWFGQCWMKSSGKSILLRRLCSEDFLNNAEIDVIWEKCQETLGPLGSDLNAALGRNWEEWEIPR